MLAAVRPAFRQQPAASSQQPAASSQQQQQRELALLGALHHQTKAPTYCVCVLACVRAFPVGAVWHGFICALLAWALMAPFLYALSRSLIYPLVVRSKDPNGTIYGCACAASICRVCTSRRVVVVTVRCMHMRRDAGDSAQDFYGRPRRPPPRGSVRSDTIHSSTFPKIDGGCVTHQAIYSSCVINGTR